MSLHIGELGVVTTQSPEITDFQCSFQIYRVVEKVGSQMAEPRVMRNSGESHSCVAEQASNKRKFLIMGCVLFCYFGNSLSCDSEKSRNAQIGMYKGTHVTHCSREAQLFLPVFDKTGALPMALHSNSI